MALVFTTVIAEADLPTGAIASSWLPTPQGIKTVTIKAGTPTMAVSFPFTQASQVITLQVDVSADGSTVQQSWILSGNGSIVPNPLPRGDGVTKLLFEMTMPTPTPAFYRWSLVVAGGPISLSVSLAVS